MGKKLVFVGVLLASCAAAVTAVAGFSQASQVYISDTYMFADGTVTGASRSPDSQQYIMCSASAWSTSGAPDASCVAVNSAGTVRSCYAKNDAQRQIMMNVTPASYIAFYWQSDGYCNYVSVSNGSRWQ
jgi:hypothetical protein